MSRRATRTKPGRRCPYYRRRSDWTRTPADGNKPMDILKRPPGFVGSFPPVPDSIVVGDHVEYHGGRFAVPVVVAVAAAGLVVPVALVVLTVAAVVGCVVVLRLQSFDLARIHLPTIPNPPHPSPIFSLEIQQSVCLLMVHSFDKLSRRTYFSSGYRCPLRYHHLSCAVWCSILIQRVTAVL